VSGLSSGILRYNGTNGQFLGDFVAPSTAHLLAGSTIGPDGNLYVADQLNSEILRYNSQTGAFMGVFVSSQDCVPHPEEVAFGPNGDLYVSSTTGGGVGSYDGTTGKSLGVVASTNSKGNKLAAAEITFGPDGDLYISSFISDNSILRYDPKSNLTSVFIPSSIAQPAPSEVLFSTDGKYLYNGTFGSSISIKKYDAKTGALLGYLVPPTNNGGILSVSRMKYGPDGDIYVSDFVGNTIVRFDPDTGAPLGDFISPGYGGLYNPSGFNFFTSVPEGSSWLGAFSFAAYFSASVIVRAKQKSKIKRT